MHVASVAVSGQALLHRPLEIAGADLVQRLLRQSDAAFANLEATVDTIGAWPTKTKTLHLAQPAALQSLRELGFTGLTHANNHAFDLGPPGILRTRIAAAEAGLQLAGSGRNAGEAGAPMILGRGRATVAVLGIDLGPQPDIVYAGPDRAGISPLRLRRRVTVTQQDFEILRRLAHELGDDRREAARAAVGYQRPAASGERIGFFGTHVQPGAATASEFVPEPEDLATFAARMTEARSMSDLVVVALHSHNWDSDWTRTPEWMLSLCRELIDEGADVVVGTGAPVLQPIAFHRGKPILPGLGNFVFHTRRASSYDREGVPVWTGAVVGCRFDLSDRRCSGVELLPVAVGRPSQAELAPAPTPLQGQQAEEVFTFLTQNIDARHLPLVTRTSGM